MLNALFGGFHESHDFGEHRAVRTASVSVTSSIVGIWPTGEPDRDEPSRVRMLGLLSAMGESDCLSRFLFDAVVPDYTGGENGELPAAMEAVGPEIGTRFLIALVDARFWRRPEDLLALLRRLEDEGGASTDRPSAGMVSILARRVDVSFAP